MNLGLVAKADSRVAADLAEVFAARGLTVARLDAARVAATSKGDVPAGPGFDAVVDCHVVDRGTKTRGLADLDAALGPETPILTCCHAATVTSLAAGARHPERFVGFGLLPPWSGRTTVECARGLATSDAAAEAAAVVWHAAGLEAVWVGDSAGLVVPRIVACLANEAAFALMEGTASPEDIDRAMELGTRYPRGPLSWAVEVGLDHIVAILDGLSREFDGDRYRAAPLLRGMAIAGGGGMAVARPWPARGPGGP